MNKPPLSLAPTGAQHYEKPYQRQTRNYTISDAHADIEHMGRRFDTLEAERHSLQQEVDALRHDEWRALHLVKMLTQRIDILESAMLAFMKPECQKYLTHQVIDAMRASDKVGLQ